MYISQWLDISYYVIDYLICHDYDILPIIYIPMIIYILLCIILPYLSWLWYCTHNIYVYTSQWLDIFYYVLYYLICHDYDILPIIYIPMIIYILLCIILPYLSWLWYCTHNIYIYIYIPMIRYILLCIILPYLSWLWYVTHNPYPNDYIYIYIYYYVLYYLFCHDYDILPKIHIPMIIYLTMYYITLLVMIMIF